MLDPHFVILGAIINVGGSLTYVVHTLQGKTRPNRVSFFMWTLAPMIAFAAQVKSGVGVQALMTFAAGFSPLLILLASFYDKKSVWKLSGFDFICGFLSLVGLILWLVTGKGILAIVFSIFADGMAALPTIVKSYSYPETESWLGYFSGFVSAALTLLTIDTWTFENYGFAAYIAAVCLLLTILIRFKFGKWLNRRLVLFNN